MQIGLSSGAFSFRPLLGGERGPAKETKKEPPCNFKKAPNIRVSRERTWLSGWCCAGGGGTKGGPHWQEPFQGFSGRAGRLWRYWGSDCGMTPVREKFLYTWLFSCRKEPIQGEMDDVIANENMDKE